MVLLVDITANITQTTIDCGLIHGNYCINVKIGYGEKKRPYYSKPKRRIKKSSLKDIK